MCADRTKRKTRKTELKCCNQAQKDVNPLSLLANPAVTVSAIFAPAMRSLCVAQLYRQYIAVPLKYMAIFTFA